MHDDQLGCVTSPKAGEIVVDDAIVMLESISRQMEMWQPGDAGSAARHGRSRFHHRVYDLIRGGRVNPMLSMGGIPDKLLHEFAVIIMTTFIGTLPIAMGFGAGSEARRPLGHAVVGGLLVSQLLTLYITPVVYLYLERARTWRGRGRSRHSLPTRADA